MLRRFLSRLVLLGAVLASPVESTYSFGWARSCALAGESSVRTAAAAVAVAPRDDIGRRLLEAYPDHLATVDGNVLIWRDGTGMPLDDGRGDKSPEAWLDAPDIADMLRDPYVAGPLADSPQTDPGRARNAQFFERMYGDCSKGQVAGKLVEIVWLPKRHGKTLKVTRINGVAERLAAISRELEQLPPSFDRYLMPPAGTYVCRSVAGSARTSAHGYGIAIDIAVPPADYWRWTKPRPGQPLPDWRNRVPIEIVTIFERHGFIWGGKWRHFDTMHFEYRPELLPPAVTP